MGQVNMWNKIGGLIGFLISKVITQNGLNDLNWVSKKFEDPFELIFFLQKWRARVLMSAVETYLSIYFTRIKMARGILFNLFGFEEENNTSKVQSNLILFWRIFCIKF